MFIAEKIVSLNLKLLSGILGGSVIFILHIIEVLAYPFKITDTYVKDGLDSTLPKRKASSSNMK